MIPITALLLSILFSLASPPKVAAQEQNPQQTGAEQGPEPRSAWSWLKEGTVSFNARYRFEAFERDGAPFTAPAYAPTLRIALAYQTPSFHGFSAFAQGEGVIVTGPADYNDPTLPSQVRPDRPIILDPKSLDLSQGYVSWTHRIREKKLVLTVGRQEMVLNDGRFLGVSYWRQVHGSFDAARLDADLPRNVSFTYAFIAQVNRVVGYNATDGQLPMHTQMMDLAWTEPDRIKLSLYALLLDYSSRAQFDLSTQTYGLRVTGPFQLNKNWSVVYTAEYAKQENYGANPNKVNANYYLGELGPGWHGFAFKAGDAFLSGRSSSNLLTTPLAPPFNGWTDLFVNTPSVSSGHGLNAHYITASGPLRWLGGALGTLTLYDYRSDFPRVHYGSELDAALAYKIKRVSNRWEVGGRFGRYWADHLFSNAVRTSLYTSFTL